MMTSFLIFIEEAFLKFYKPPPPMLSCENYEFFRIAVLKEHPRKAASVLSLLLISVIFFEL